MTIVAVTGTSYAPGGFMPPELRVLHDFVDGLGSDVERFDTGGCEGIDGLLTRLAARHGLPTRAYLATATFKTDWAALEEAETELIITEVNLLARNRLMVDGAGELHAFGLHAPQRQPRSGTWATARYAQLHGKLATITIFRPGQDNVPAPLRLESGATWCLCPTRTCRCALEPMQL